MGVGISFGMASLHGDQVWRARVRPQPGQPMSTNDCSERRLLVQGQIVSAEVDAHESINLDTAARTILIRFVGGADPQPIVGRREAKALAQSETKAPVRALERKLNELRW